ncbi:MAG: hypothetical protein K0R39_2439 [Symbiobacteriaceae bacterium]|jgi:hypothetical protein|nr:hypothetical protein [Symbiobacteriaceae bacterium]
MQIKLTAQSDVEILGCPRCDTALQPQSAWPRGGPAEAVCPLCGFVQSLDIVEVGDAVPFNPEQQREDAAASPIYSVAGVTYDEDLALVDVPDLLDDPVYFALQDGVAPVASFGWVGGPGIRAGAPETPAPSDYRLFLVVRVTGLPEGEDDLFRLEFPDDARAQLAGLNDDRTVVLVSQRKGVFFAEAGDVYLQAVRDAGSEPGEPVAINTWVALEDNL